MSSRQIRVSNPRFVSARDNTPAEVMKGVLNGLGFTDRWYEKMSNPEANRRPIGKYEKLGQEIGKLVDEKNVAYGDSFNLCGEFLKLLYPDGIQPEQYKDALALVRIFDKQKRIATKGGPFEESPYRDIAGYGMLGACDDNLK